MILGEGGGTEVRGGKYPLFQGSVWNPGLCFMLSLPCFSTFFTFYYPNSSLHLITCLCHPFSNRHMLEMKFAIHHRAAEDYPHMEQASLIDVRYYQCRIYWRITDLGICLSIKSTLLWMDDKASSPSFEDLWYSYTHAVCSDHTWDKDPPTHTE